MKMIDPNPDILNERREDFDKPIKRTVAEGACFLCAGWGYPTLDFEPKKIGGKWAINVKGKACRVCAGSGLDPKEHTQDQIAKGRAYQQMRINKLIQWLAADMDRRQREKEQKQ